VVLAKDPTDEEEESLSSVIKDASEIRVTMIILKPVRLSGFKECPANC